MKKTLLASVALLFVGSSLSFAAVPPTVEKSGFSNDTSTMTQEVRRKRRVPGGSGCDDPGDVAEHPECRV